MSSRISSIFGEAWALEAQAKQAAHLCDCALAKKRIEQVRQLLKKAQEKINAIPSYDPDSPLPAEIQVASHQDLQKALDQIETTLGLLEATMRLCKKDLYPYAKAAGSFQGSHVKDHDEIRFVFRFTDDGLAEKCEEYCLIQVQHFVDAKTGLIIDPPSKARKRKETQTGSDGKPLAGSEALDEIFEKVNPIPRDEDSCKGYVVDTPPIPIPGRDKVSPCFFPEPTKKELPKDLTKPNEDKTKGLLARDIPGDLKSGYDVIFETFAVCLKPNITILASMRWRLSISPKWQVEIIPNGKDTDWGNASTPAQKALKKFIENHK